MKKLRITYNAPVMLTFVLLCFAATLLGVLTGNMLTGLLFSVYRSSWANPLTYLRLFTHVLGHAGFEHFIGNATFLLLLGPMLEEKYGSRTMLKVILLTAGVTGLAHCLFWGNSSLCGASGVVFACILLSSFTEFREKEIPLSFILIAVLFIGQEIYKGIAIDDNISNLTHILGGAVGGVYGYLLNRRKSKT